MAKDPAFLFYPGDWQGGTSTFSRFLKGCYMDVLIAQFNNGHLSLDEIKTVLGSDFGTAWPTLQKKFIKDEDGLLFNEKLDNEITKRRLYSESRRKNREGNTHDSTYDKHMTCHVENGNRNETSLEKKSEKKVSRGTDELIPLPFNSHAFTFAWSEWMHYRKEVKKKVTPSTAKKQLAYLSRYPEDVAIEMINQSIEKGWTGLFEVESKAKKPNGKNDRTEQTLNDIAIALSHAAGTGTGA